MPSWPPGHVCTLTCAPASRSAAVNARSPGVERVARRRRRAKRAARRRPALAPRDHVVAGEVGGVVEGARRGLAAAAPQRRRVAADGAEALRMRPREVEGAEAAHRDPADRDAAAVGAEPADRPAGSPPSSHTAPHAPLLRLCQYEWSSPAGNATIGARVPSAFSGVEHRLAQRAALVPPRPCRNTSSGRSLGPGPGTTTFTFMSLSTGCAVDRQVGDLEAVRRLGGGFATAADEHAAASTSDGERSVHRPETSAAASGSMLSSIRKRSSSAGRNATPRLDH